MSESEGDDNDDDLRLQPHERLVDLGGKRVAVVGLGASGLAAAALALDRGASRVAMLDSNPSGPTDAQVEVARDLESSGSCEVALRFGPHDLADFEGCDVIVCSPGVPASSIAPLVPPAATLVSELAFALCEITQNFAVPVACVTGTNGKTTTTTFLCSLLEGLGKTCEACGNIGLPASDVCLRLRRGVRGEGNGTGGLDCLAVEVSSYQLEIESCRDLFRPRAAAILNLTDDHAERHGGVEGYARAKASLAHAMRPGVDTLVLPRESESHPCLEATLGEGAMDGAVRMGALPGATARLGHGASIRVQLPWWHDPREFSLGETFLERCAGDHNAMNAAAALILCFALGFDWPRRRVEAALDALEPPPHRLERLGVTGGGVAYVNDSKATNADSVRVALESLGGARARCVLMLGGRGKILGESGSLGLQGLADGVKEVVCFGESGAKIAEEVGARQGLVFSTIAEALEAAHGVAEEGDTVLLSPACASFDEFGSFEERGEWFRRAFESLREGRKRKM